MEVTLSLRRFASGFRAGVSTLQAKRRKSKRLGTLATIKHPSGAKLPALIAGIRGPGPCFASLTDSTMTSA